ncbi:MAG: DUF1573 domain-containing protein [Mariniphaga sp.]
MSKLKNSNYEKRINRIFGTISFLLMVFGVQLTNGQSLADIKFEKMDYNFGKIKEADGPAIYDFKFTNTGKIPLIIQGVEASCGCTTPEWSREPLLPGKTGFIKVSYNPEFRPGIFTKSISVMANIPKSVVVLTITGEVIPRELKTEDIYAVDFGKIRLKSKELSFLKVKDNEIKTDTLRFYNPGIPQVTVSFKDVPSYITIRTVPAIVPSKSDGFFIISFDGTKKPSYGYLSSSIPLSFNGEKKFDYSIKIGATVEEDFSKLSESELANAPVIDFNSRTFDFGVIQEGKKVDYLFKITNKGKKELIIRNVSVSCECVVAKPSSTKIPVGGSTEMKVSFDSNGKVGMQNKMITVISNDPGHSTTVLRVAGTVKR